MSKFDFDVAVAFGTQTAEGTYNATLDAISATLNGNRNPGGADSDDGLVLGDSQSGIAESGLTLAIGRRSREKAVVSGSLTRSLSDFLAAESRTFTFAFPFCNHRANVQVTPADGDFVPLAGVDSLLEGVGLVGAAWGGGVGHLYQFGSPNPISALIYYFGNRLELLDCRVSNLAIDFTPGSISIATATIEVGSIKDPSASGFSVASLPTLDYGEQATVSAPVVESVGHSWQASRGFSALTLTIAQTIEDVPDSQATDGIVKEVSARETTIEATLFADDASSNEVYELDQIFQTASGGLDPLSFQVGATAGSSDPALAVQITVDQPEVDQTAMQRLGTKAANTVNLIARHTTANNELDVLFR